MSTTCAKPDLTKNYTNTKRTKSMTEILQVLIFVYAIISIFTLIYSVGTCMRSIWTTSDEQRNDYMFFCFPKQLYKTTKMNMFGCILCFILFLLFDTIYVVLCLIVQLIYSIIGFIYYICHVGREDEE